MSTEFRQAAYAVGKTVQFAFPLVWTLLVRRSDLAWRRPDAAGLGMGAAFGAGAGGLMLAAYFLLGQPLGWFDGVAPVVQEKTAALGLNGPAKFLAVAAAYSLAHAGLEEYYWRWFTHRRCAERLPAAAAIAVSSLGFAAHHVILLGTYFGWASPLTWLCSASVAVGGAFWAWLYARSGSLLGPWLSHALIDAAIFAIGYDLARGGWS